MVHSLLTPLEPYLGLSHWRVGAIQPCAPEHKGHSLKQGLGDRFLPRLGARVEKTPLNPHHWPGQVQFSPLGIGGREGRKQGSRPHTLGVP